MKRALLVLTMSIGTAAPAFAQSATSPLTLQFLAYELPPEPISVVLDATTLDDALKAIAKAGAVRLQFAPSVQDLTKPTSVSVRNEPVEAALRKVLDAHALAFVVTSRGTVFVYPRTPADQEKYAQTVRDFTLVKGNPSAIMAILNMMSAGGELKLEPFGQRPAIATEGRVIRARATAKVMDQIAKVIAANDK